MCSAINTPEVHVGEHVQYVVPRYGHICDKSYTYKPGVIREISGPFIIVVFEDDQWDVFYAEELEVIPPMAAESS